MVDHRRADMVSLKWKSVKEKKRTAEDIRKEIDQQRAALDKIPHDDFSSRVKIMHSVTRDILSYIQFAGPKDQHAEPLLQVGLVNAREEVSIMTLRHELTASAMHLFGSALWASFEIGNEPKSLDQAISSYRKALSLDNTHRDSMSDLATALWARFNRYKQQKDLDELIELYKALLFLRPVNDPNEVKWLNSVGMGLWERYRRSNDPTDMEHAIAYLRRASRSYPIPCDPFTLSNLGNALLARSRHRRDLADLDEAIFYYNRVLSTTSTLHPGRSAFLSNWGDALLEYYERTSNHGVLDDAVLAYKRALELPAPHHRDKVTCTMLYADALQARYKKRLDVDDLQQAVFNYTAAKQLATPTHHNYARLMEKLLLAEQDLRKYNNNGNGHTASPASHPRSRSTQSPASPRGRPVSAVREWISHNPVPTPPASNTNGGQKFRIVRPPTSKAYSKKNSSTSESESSPPPAEAPNPPLSPRNGLPPRARRHHALAHLS